MISVTILTKNSARYLQQVLQALARFDEIILYDTGSQDETFEIARQFPRVKIHHGIFLGFGAAHNQASALTRHDWVLSIDSDEVVTSALVDEIFSLRPQPDTLYSISRNNFYRNKLIKGCGWYPDRVLRLYNKTKTCFSDDLVHEKILSEQLTVFPLKAPLEHFPYNSIDDFISKMQSYTTLFAKQYSHTRKATFATAITHSMAAFMKSYVLKKGFLLGTEGMEISLYNAITSYYKYLKLRDLNIL